MDAAPVIVRPGMAFDEYWERFMEEPFELINGEVFVLSPNEIKHNLIGKRLVLIFAKYLEKHPAGTDFYETPFTLIEGKKWVKDSMVPDAMFITAERLTPYQQIPNWDMGPFRIAPDLVIEIVSPTDRPKPMLQKVVAYLENGVQVVWVIDPKRHTVSIYSDVEQPIILNADQMLTGGALLPGFELPIQKLFED